jgi:hypothetical protein
VSKEAKQNPILAFHLIADGIPHQQAIARLQGSVRQLSPFTRRVMENAYPGWELLDAEDQNMAAFQHSMINGDTNGYRAGFNAALSALEKFVEPLRLTILLIRSWKEGGKDYANARRNQALQR